MGFSCFKKIVYFFFFQVYCLARSDWESDNCSSLYLRPPPEAGARHTAHSTPTPESNRIKRSKKYTIFLVQVILKG